MSPNAICLKFDIQLIVLAFSRAIPNAGSSIAARMAMIAITIRSSIIVNLINSPFKLKMRLT